MNNLHYVEDISASNPCAEQPLPPFGACLLGSFNLVKYVDVVNQEFDWTQFRKDIRVVVRAMDNVVDRTIYPLEEQEIEAKSKRRMGLGITGLANAGEMCGFPYASDAFMGFMESVLRNLRDTSYDESAELAKEKGPFPLWEWEAYSKSKFIETLPKELQDKILATGIRNSHLTSIAPTGTISLTADNVSSGIEPPFMLFYDRTIEGFDGQTIERVEDYAYAQGIKAAQLTRSVLTTMSRYSHWRRSTSTAQCPRPAMLVMMSATTSLRSCTTRPGFMAAKASQPSVPPAHVGAF